jgi:hypothetical protein
MKASGLSNEMLLFLSVLVLAIALGVIGVLTLTSCAPQMTAEDHALTGAEFTEQLNCINAYADAGRNKVDACRARVKAFYDARWAAEFDGGAQ